MVKVKFFNIEWDTEGEDMDLPISYALEVDKNIDLDANGADMLSDIFGWCVTSFQYKIIK